MQQPSAPAPDPATATINSPWRSPWVLGWLALVGVVVLVNAAFIYVAVATNPGLVASDYYDRGQHYEKTLVSRLAKNPGWLLHADLPDPLRANEPATVLVTLVDQAGQPVTPDQVTFFAYRPADQARDFTVPMAVAGPGRYAAAVTFPLFGAWDWLVAVRQGDDEFTSGERVSVARR